MVGVDPAWDIWEQKEKTGVQKILLREKYGVKIGVQHHFGYMTANSMKCSIWLKP